MSTHLDRRPSGDGNLEDALRDAFRHGAEGMPRTVDPWTRTTTAVRRSQIRRRAAVLAAAAVLAVGVTGAASGVLPVHRASGPAVTPPTGDVRVTSDDLMTWPLRGDLAEDPTSVGLVEQAFSLHGTLARLLFVGRLDGRRLGVGLLDRHDPAVGRLELGAVLEPAAGTPGDWTPVGFTVTDLGVVSLATQSDDGSVDLLVLGRTDADVMAYSRAAEYDEQGRPSRTFERLSPRDGVATVRLGPGPLTTISVLVDGSATTDVPTGVQLVESRWEAVRPSDDALAQAAADPRCGRGVTAMDVGNVVNGVSANRDPMHAPQSVRAVWCREVDGGRVLLFAVTLQDGSTFLAEMLEARDPHGVAMVNGVGRAVPRGAGLTTPVVLPDLPVDGAVLERRLFVHAPGAATVDLVLTDRTTPERLLRARPDRDGFTELRLTAAQAERVPGDGSAKMVLRDAAGRRIGELPVDDLGPEQDVDTDLLGPVR